MKTIALSLFLITFSLLSCFSQGLSTNETIVYINGKFSSKFQVRVEEEREMLIDFYRGGEIYRTDRVYLPTLDHKKMTVYTSLKNTDRHLNLPSPQERLKAYEKIVLK